MRVRPVDRSELARLDVPAVAVSIDTPRESLKARSASGVIWGFIDATAQQVLTLLIFVILGRILSPALFGIVSTALVFVFLMRSTVLNAVSTSLVTLKAPVDADYDTAFWILLGISLSAVLILNVAADPLSRLYAIPQFARVIRATSVIVLIFGLSYAHIGWARRNFQFKALAYRSVAGVVAGGIVGIAIAVMGYGIEALVLNQLVAGLVSLFLLWRIVPWRPKLRFSTQRARTLMQTALPLGATQSLQFAVQNFDTALVTYLLGPHGGGLYAGSKRIVLAIQLAVWQPISGVSLPTFAEVIDDEKRLSKATVKTAGLVATITFPLFAAVAMSASALMLTLFGDKWAEAAPVLKILSLFGAVVPSVGILHQIVIARGRTHAVMWFTLLQTMLAIGTVMIGQRDPRVIALCLSVPALATYMLTLAYLTWLGSFPLAGYSLALARPLLATLVMSAAMGGVAHLGFTPFIDLIAELVGGGISYTLAFWLIARDSFKEIVELGRALLVKRFRQGEVVA